MQCPVVKYIQIPEQMTNRKCPGTWQKVKQISSGSTLEKHDCFNLVWLPTPCTKALLNKDVEMSLSQITLPSEICLVFLREDQNGFTMMMLINYTSQKQHDLDQHTIIHDSLWLCKLLNPFSTGGILTSLLTNGHSVNLAFLPPANEVGR